MHLFTLLLLLFSSLLRANVDAIFSDDEDLAICHHVNVMTGNLNLHFQDAIIEGAQKLPLMRTYTSAGAMERTEKNEDFALKGLLGSWLIQGGWSIMPHVHLIVQTYQNERDIQVFLPEKNGATVEYVYEYSTVHWIYLKPKINAGQCSGILSARTNPRNNRLRINHIQTEAYLSLPDGGERYYQIPKEMFSNDDRTLFLLLRKETLPSKHVITYKFKETMLVDVSIKSPDEKKSFASLHISKPSGGPGTHKLLFRAEGSDGTSFDYRALRYKGRSYISEVYSNCRPKESNHYVPSRKKRGARMRSVTLGDRFQFSAHYNEPHNRKHARNVSRHLPWPYPLDKVRLIEAPVGTNGETIPLAQFTYEPDHTDIKDHEGILTRYHHDKIRLNAIDYFNERGELLSHMKMYWEGEKLKGKALLAPTSQAHFSRTFTYDDKGNVTEEVLWGNLTGNCPGPFAPDASGQLPQAESYRKTYAYDSQSNVPHWEKEEGGPTYRYRYLPGTNLLSAQFFAMMIKSSPANFSSMIPTTSSSKKSSMTAGQKTSTISPTSPCALAKSTSAILTLAL